MATQKLAISQKMRSLPWIDIGTLAVGSLLALALRLCLVMFKSGDFYLFFKEWYQAIQAQGFRSIVTLQYDYTPPYLYLLYIVSALFPKLQPAAALKVPPSWLISLPLTWFTRLSDCDIRSARRRSSHISSSCFTDDPAEQRFLGTV